MAQITTLATTENGKNSRVIINTNFDNLNTEVTTATGDIATLEATVNTGALAGTSGTPSGTNRFVTDDDTSSTPSPNKVVRFTSAGEISGIKPVIEDSTYPAGETLSAGNVVFIENAPTTAQATSAQNIGDVSANTRVSFPVFGSGVAGTTLALNLAKTGSPSVAIGVRIETDNNGNPSGTLVNANATGTVAAASLGTDVFYGTVTDVATTAPTFFGNGTVGNGFEFYSKARLSDIVVTKASLCTATRAVLKSEAGAILATATFSGDTATIVYTTTAGTTYRIEADSNGATYASYHNSLSSFPYNKTNINITNGSQGGVDYSYIVNILSLTTTGNNDTTVTLAGSITIPAGQKCHIVTYQGTYGSETVNASNYYKIGYYTNDSQTRYRKIWSGSSWSAIGGSLLEAHGVTLGTNLGVAGTSKYGLKFQSAQSCWLYSITKDVSCDATTAALKSSGGTVLQTVSFSSNIATFTPVEFTAGTIFRIELYSASGHTARRGAATYPYNKSNINFIAGSVDGADDTSYLYSITDITTAISSSTTTVPYTSSTLFQPRVLSKTDADFSYKIDWHGITQEAVTAGDLTTGKYPKIAVGGIDSNQTGMTQGTTMYLSNTAGSISSSAGTNSKKLGKSISDTKIKIVDIPL